MLKFNFAGIVSVRSTHLWEKGRIRIRIREAKTHADPADSESGSPPLAVCVPEYVGDALGCPDGNGGLLHHDLPPAARLHRVRDHSSRQLHVLKSSRSKSSLKIYSSRVEYKILVVFWPPGSGSISQRYWIRIRIRIRILISTSKIVRKTLIPNALWLH